MIRLEKNEIKEELKAIAKMVKKEYDFEPRKTIRKIYQSIADLHSKIGE